MAYASAANLISRKDVRKLGQLVRDNNSQATSAELLSDQTIADALEDASAQIRSAAMVADKYQQSDLDQLAADSDAFLVRLTCDLAMGYLMSRRYLTEELPPDVVNAQQWLALLRLGERIFNVESNKTAGNLNTSFMTPAKRSTANLVADSGRFFPPRGQV